MNLGANVKAVIGEHLVHSLTGEAGGCFPGAVEEEHGIAVGRGEVELEAVDDGGGGVVVVAVVEVQGGVVTSSPSCDPWMSQGC